MQVWFACPICHTRMAVEAEALASDEWKACPLCEVSTLQVYVDDAEEEYA